ncbi:unnamed protein product [Vicia faba]|uniref:Secreted protein n=1 Tax=Vicia faba TaxID=3906 RepID=A0AAV0YII7_VICFA|nr:unnamed protein product [Vicia faba]
MSPMALFCSIILLLYKNTLGQGNKFMVRPSINTNSNPNYSSFINFISILFIELNFFKRKEQIKKKKIKRIRVITWLFSFYAKTKTLPSHLQPAATDSPLSLLLQSMNASASAISHLCFDLSSSCHHS